MAPQCTTHRPLPTALWDASLPPASRSLWNARVFPAETDAGLFGAGCGCSGPERPRPSNGRPCGRPTATASRKWPCWPTRRHFTCAAVAFTWRPCGTRFATGSATRAAFRLRTGASHREFRPTGDWVAAVLREARRREASQAAEPVCEAFSFARTIHTPGIGLEQGTGAGRSAGNGCARRGNRSMPEMHEWLDRHGIALTEGSDIADWAGCASRWPSITCGGRSSPAAAREDLSCGSALAERRDRLGAGPGPARPGRRLDRHPALHVGERRDGPQRRRAAERSAAGASLRPGERASP